MVMVPAIQSPDAPASRQNLSRPLSARDTNEVILETRAAFKRVPRSGWRPCRISVTPNRITLAQGGRVVLEVPADLIVGAPIERVRSALGRKEVLCLEYRPARDKYSLSRVWLTGRDLHTLQEKLADLAARIDLPFVESLASRLDADAEGVIRFLWDRRHATIRELAEHTGMPSHMDVLLKIKEVINPVAEEFLGFPLLTFAPARYDRVVDAAVFNSWWMLGCDSRDRAAPLDILVDTFKEKDGFSILACLPCGEADEINVTFSAGKVEISCGQDVRPAGVSLPTGAEPKNCRQTFRNGVLELRWDCMSQTAAAVEEK